MVGLLTKMFGKGKKQDPVLKEIEEKSFREERQKLERIKLEQEIEKAKERGRSRAEPIEAKAARAAKGAGRLAKGAYRGAKSVAKGFGNVQKELRASGFSMENLEREQKRTTKKKIKRRQTKQKKEPYRRESYYSQPRYIVVSRPQPRRKIKATSSRYKRTKKSKRKGKRKSPGYSEFRLPF